MESALYIHIPYCLSKCAYCDFFSVPCGKRAVPDEYVSSLLNEIRWRAKKKGVASFTTVYAGGGTPSLLSPAQIDRISSAVSSLSEKDIKEFTIEANPDDITPEFVSCLNSSCINRLSVGIQSFEEKTLAFVQRRSSPETVRRALSFVKKDWSGIFSADMIAALPFQTCESFLNGLSELVSYEPDHISLYSLTIEEETVLGKKLERGELLYDFVKADEMWIRGRDFLKKNGYAQYEVSNFSRKGCKCAHNLTYWRLENYLGCGAGATGTFYGKEGFRFTNTSDIASYIKFWKDVSPGDPVDEVQVPGVMEPLSKETEMFEFFMMGLRTLEGVSLSEFERRFQVPPDSRCLSLMKEWERSGRGFFRREGENLFFSMNEQGILFLNDFLREII